jgi:UDP-N-acetylmuramoylalanine--D-glutamate ligase
MVNEEMKRIVILGAAESGVGAAALAKVKGFDVFVSDMGRIKEDYRELLRQYDVPWEEGQHTESLILNANEVVKSPGIPEDAPMVCKVRNAGIPIISEIEFAGRYTDAKMICITGSNGKTTTTSLIYHIFQKAGYNVGLAGNIGRSLALQIAEGKTYEYYIIELSSFQLDNMYDFRANIAILLNITPDHLDRYDNSMQNYTDAKMRIVQNQTEEDAFIYWNEDPIIAAELRKYGIKAKMCPFSIIKKTGMIGYIADGQYVIEYPTPFNMEQESLSLHGKHNMYNSLAAGIAARISGIDDETLRQSLSDFEGVEHRLQKVARVGGVQYINDSKATNVDACWYALESMTTPTILIIGGKDKGNDYNAIKELVQKKCAGLVYLGADNSKLHAFFDGMGIPVADTNNMKDCVAACSRMAKPGYTVLLSPCCASFDLFKNMEDRGEQFCEQVKNL